MPVRVVSARESAERDQAAIEKGIPSRALMQRAGKAAALNISRRYADRLQGGVAIFTGPGNNGGDGWVVAGILAREGVPVQVLEMIEPKTPDASAARDDALAVLPDMSIERPGLVVDALLGTGGQSGRRGTIGQAVDTINALRSGGAQVVSLDVPTGLDATTGSHSKCVMADLTLT